ncbi:hypothetical protein AMC85_CH03083 [Rhizobium phaseoli]|nr:hypothetical protein AMC88_CH03084 [Rhizobium phaseoli]ANL60437.1 hypothetical protein AMC85_CH03083 [Rhizobium phaseoli]
MNFRITSSITGLKRHTSDLERLQASGIFAPALMASPVLTHWRRGFREVGCLEGIVEGHSSLPDGHVISTSQVWAQFHDEDERFVRTLNRWHRLGSRSSVGHAPADGPLFGGRRG